MGRVGGAIIRPTRSVVCFPFRMHGHALFLAETPHGSLDVSRIAPSRCWRGLSESLQVRIRLSASWTVMRPRSDFAYVARAEVMTWPCPRPRMFSLMFQTQCQAKRERCTISVG